MRSGAGERDGTDMWEVALPERQLHLPGVRMAGFRDRGVVPIDLRVIPQPVVSLALEFGSGTPFTVEAGGWQLRGSIVAGLGAGVRSTVRVQGGSYEGVQVRLSPLVARAALGVSPAELDGAVFGLDELWGRDASHIRERLDDVSTWDQRFALTGALLARRITDGPSVDPEVGWAWRRIVATHGAVRVEALAAEVGWSRKRLWSRFQTQIGLPPKRAADLVRFDHAVHRLTAGEPATRVAADSGYADQSHLHRDIVARTGVTPASVVGEPWLEVDDVAWSSTLGRGTADRSCQASGARAGPAVTAPCRRALG